MEENTVVPAEVPEAQAPEIGLQRAIEAVDEAIREAKYIVLNPPKGPKVSMAHALAKRLNRALELQRKNEVVFAKRRAKNRMARISRRINKGK